MPQKRDAITESVLVIVSKRIYHKLKLGFTWDQKDLTMLLPCSQICVQYVMPDNYNKHASRRSVGKSAKNPAGIFIIFSHFFTCGGIWCRQSCMFVCLQGLGTKRTLHPLPTLQNNEPVPQVIEKGCKPVLQQTTKSI